MLKVILPVLILLLIDFYAFQGVKTALQDSTDVVRKIGYAIFIGLSVYIYMFFIVTRTVGLETVPSWLIRFSMMLLTISFLGKLFMLVPLLINDFGRFGSMVFNKDVTALPSRRKFVGQLALAFSALPFATLMYGIVRNAYRYQFLKTTIPIADLPNSFDGFKIVQLSDIHSGSFTKKEPLISVVEEINALNADLIVFTGDLVNDLAHEMDDYIDVFKNLKAKHGVMAVMGNHDYGLYSYQKNDPRLKENFEAFKQVHKSMGWDLLLNENRLIKNGADEIAILGIENWGKSDHFPKYGNVKQAKKGAEHVGTKILLSHDPSHWDAKVRIEDKDIQLMLSGHTHGFQFGLENKLFKWSPVQYVYKQWAGLYTQGKQHLYVNRGFGMLGYPGRIGILPEVAVLKLTKA